MTVAVLEGTVSSAAPGDHERFAAQEGVAGNTWERHGFGKAGFDRTMAVIEGLAAGRRGFVATTNAASRRDQPRVWTSSDGRQWSRVPRDDSPRARRLQTVGPIVGSSDALVTFVQVWRQTTLRPGDELRRTRSVWWSRDGRVWERVSLAAFRDSYVFDVDAGPTGFVAVGVRDRRGVERPAAWHSVDGRVWTRATVPAGASGPSRVANLRSSYVAAGGQGGPQGVWTSSEGRAWRVQDSNLPDAFVINLSSVPDGVVAITEPRDVAIPGDSLWITKNGHDWKPLPAFHEAFPASVADEVIDLSGTWVMAGSNSVGPESGSFTFTAWTRTRSDHWTEMPAHLTKPFASSGPRMAAHRKRIVVMTSHSNAFWTWGPP